METFNHVCLHLPDGLDAFPEGAVYDDPGQEQTARQVPSDQVDVCEACGDSKHPLTTIKYVSSFEFFK